MENVIEDCNLDVRGQPCQFHRSLSSGHFLSDTQIIVSYIFVPFGILKIFRDKSDKLYFKVDKSDKVYFL